MNPKLSGLNNVALVMINLDKKQNTDVCRCIANYSFEADGLIDQISYVSYIIMESIKFYFEMSDWDRAVKALELKEKSLLPQIILKITPDSLIHRTSEYTLEKLVELNRIKTPQPPQMVIEMIQDNLTVDHFAAFAGQVIKDILD